MHQRGPSSSRVDGGLTTDQITNHTSLASCVHGTSKVSYILMSQDDTPFAFPGVHEFAPFYTLQPNPETAAIQVDLWARLILSFCAAHHRFQLEVGGAWERESDLFCHRGLDRALSPDTVRLIFAYMVEKGRAAYDPPLPRGYKVPRVGQVDADRRMHALSVAGLRTLPALQVEPGSKIWVYWNTPTEWGDQLYEWVKQTGQNRSVLTLYELQQSTFVQREQLPPAMLMRALETLVARKCAQIFEGTEPTDGGDHENLGVKFV